MVLNNIIDVEGKVKQKENNYIDNVFKSEEEVGDLTNQPYQILPILPW